jgi:histidinol-phosphate aminotransferase
MTNPLALVRPDLRSFTPYAHAVYDTGLSRLHANESYWRHAFDDCEPGLNVYPDPQPDGLLGRLAALYGLAPTRVLLTRGSDDGIDVLTRACCQAGRDPVLICSPTFGMYAVAARIQGVAVIDVPLVEARGFAIDEAAVIAAARDEGAKLVFLCSPNNPTGNAVEPAVVARICEALSDQAMIVVDEAYGEFSSSPGALSLLDEFANLVVLRTLSKAYALAGARLGVLAGAPALLSLLRTLLPPYLIPTPSLAAAETLLTPESLARVRAEIDGALARRGELAAGLAELGSVERVWPSETNFLLVKCRNAGAVLEACREEGLLVRDFSRQPRLEGCLRVTVGSADEVVRVLRAFASADGSRAA